MKKNSLFLFVVFAMANILVPLRAQARMQCIDLFRESVESPFPSADQILSPEPGSFISMKLDMIALNPAFFGLKDVSPAQLRLALKSPFRSPEESPIVARVMMIVEDRTLHGLFIELSALKEVFEAIVRSRNGRIVTDMNHSIVFDDIEPLLIHYINNRQIPEQKMAELMKFLDGPGKTMLNPSIITFVKNIRWAKIKEAAARPLELELVDSEQANAISPSMDERNALVWKTEVTLARSFPKASTLFKVKSLEGAVEAHVKINFVSEGMKTLKQARQMLPEDMNVHFSQNEMWFTLVDVQLIIGPLDNPTSVQKVTVPLTAIAGIRLYINKTAGLRFTEDIEGNFSLSLTVAAPYPSNVHPNLWYNYRIRARLP